MPSAPLSHDLGGKLATGFLDRHRHCRRHGAGRLAVGRTVLPRSRHAHGPNLCQRIRAADPNAARPAPYKAIYLAHRTDKEKPALLL